MATNKTQPTTASVTDYLDGISPVRRREEGHALRELMEDVTGTPAVMWGPSIVGFGTYTYRYASGRTGDWMRVGFSPRKAALSLYGLKDEGVADAVLAELGPHTAGAGCVYVKRLDEIDLEVLRDLIALAWERSEGHDPS